MSLTVQQLIADAKKLSTRLMDRDQSADRLISRGQDVLKEVEAMRQYQENIENLNEIAHQRPRAHLVLGIQQENRHIRSLQQENKELRATLEEHQATLELIMSKYREHISRMIKSTGKIEYNPDNLAKQLHEKTMKVYEMAAVMKEAVKRDEEKDDQERELIARLYTENKGLRELLEISQKGKSVGTEKRTLTGRREFGVQTEELSSKTGDDKVDLEITLSMPAPPPRHNRSGVPGSAGSGSSLEKVGLGGSQEEQKKMPNNVGAPLSPVDTSSHSDTSSLSASESDETSDDDSIKFDTIKLRRKNPPLDKTATEVTPKKGDSVRLPGPLNNSQDHISPSASQKLEGKSPTTVSLEHHMNAINNNTSTQAQPQPAKSPRKEKSPSPKVEEKTPPSVKQPVSNSPISADADKTSPNTNHTEAAADKSSPKDKRSSASPPKEEKVKASLAESTMQPVADNSSVPESEKCDPSTDKLEPSNQNEAAENEIVADHVIIADEVDAEDGPGGCSQQVQDTAINNCSSILNDLISEATSSR